MNLRNRITELEAQAFFDADVPEAECVQRKRASFNEDELLTDLYAFASPELIERRVKDYFKSET